MKRAVKQNSGGGSNKLMCTSKMIMAILFEMRMDLRFKRYYWKLTKFTWQYWNKTKKSLPSSRRHAIWRRSREYCSL
jgi:hypothetical protein